MLEEGSFEVDGQPVRRSASSGSTKVRKIAPEHEKLTVLDIRNDPVQRVPRQSVATVSPTREADQRICKSESPSTNSASGSRVPTSGLCVSKSNSIRIKRGTTCVRQSFRSGWAGNPLWEGAGAPKGRSGQTGEERQPTMSEIFPPGQTINTKRGIPTQEKIDQIGVSCNHRRHRLDLFTNHQNQPQNHSLPHQKPQINKPRGAVCARSCKAKGFDEGRNEPRIGENPRRMFR